MENGFPYSFGTILIYVRKRPLVQDLIDFKEIGFVMRNEQMATRINQIIKDQKCSKSNVVTGNGHMMNDLSPTFSKGNIKTITDHLIDYGHQAQYYNMRSAKCSSNRYAICDVLEAVNFKLGSGMPARVKGMHSGMFVTK